MSAVRHRFVSQKPVEGFAEFVTFYGELRGTTYHKVLPLPNTLVSDLRQLVKPWNAAATDALWAFATGIATEWEGVYKGWIKAVERLQASKQAPNEVYDDNVNFWLALRKLAMQLGAKDMIVRPGEVLVWAVKDTVREHAETVKEHADAVYEAGKSAVDAARDVAGAIPTIAKALAIGGVGLGVFALVRR